jgi:hypothetical protein
MKSLIYIGSPYFDGIGITHTESKKLLECGSVTFLDGILIGKYPEIKNFDAASFIAWRAIRMRQFRESLPNHEYIYLNELLKSYQQPANVDVSIVVDVCIKDHCVCNNIAENDSKKYRSRNEHRFRHFFSSVYSSLLAFMTEREFDEIVVFNGRNSVARILIAAAKVIGIKVRWLECFGKRNGKMTYISAPFNIFDLDRYSDELLSRYKNSDDPNKDQVANDCISDRLKFGDPLLLEWGVKLESTNSTINRTKANVAAFFFSSEDEYPAFTSSRYGLKPPNNQYNIFTEICAAIISAGLHESWKICIKLHPRYIALNKKLKAARERWNDSIENATKMGVDLQVIDPLHSAYKVIEESDIVFSFGTTAWEATCMGKPAVLLGPNVFTTHGCCHIANSVSDIISYLKTPPGALPVETCYPYAWAWTEIGSSYPEFSSNKKSGTLSMIKSIFDNKFIRG